MGAHYEKDVTGNATTSYYSVGGRRIAMRVRTNSTNVVYYLHSDHLGSASLTTNASGNRVGELRYKPYGETRYAIGAFPTDRRYTGQREEAGLGLYDYSARFYDPLLARFISADTIVPSPSSPQALNRYSYVLNSPLNYRDPSGRCIPGQCPGDVGWEDTTPIIGGILFTAGEGQSWNARDQDMILSAAEAIAHSMVNALIQQNREYAKTGDFDLMMSVPSPAALFREVMGGTTFHRSSASNPDNNPNWWASVNGNTVTLWTQAPAGGYSFHNATHEMGHIFDNRTGRQARGSLAIERVSYTNGAGQTVWVAGAGRYLNDAGYAVDGPWQQNNNPALGGDSPGEELADMFLGWAWNHFANDAAGAARYDWMQEHMPGWISLVVAQ